MINWQDRENPHAGGAELHLHEVFGRIAAAGHDVHVLCSGFRGAAPSVVLDGMHVHRVGSRFSFPLYARRGYAALRRGGAFDVVVEDLNKVPLFVRRWGMRRLVVLTHHLFGATAFREESIPVAAATWLAERPLARAYRGVPFEAVSQSTRDDLVARGVPAAAITVIYNGVDVAALTPAPAARSPVPLFVYLGRLKRYKRVDVVIRAFALLDRPAARLEIAGKGDDRPRLERLVSRLGVADRVHFRGYVSEPEKEQLLRRAWASVLASPKEGWGISNLESAACGTPVIAADSPGIRESVLDGDTGFLVPGSDPAAFTAAMRGLVEQPELVERLGRNARQFAGTFTWERTARDTLAHLERVSHGGY